MNKAEQHHESQRKKIWGDAVTAVAGAENCMNATVAITWADKILKAFDDRFKKPEGEKE